MPQTETVFCDGCKDISPIADLKTKKVVWYEIVNASGNNPAKFSFMRFKCPQCKSKSSSSVALRDIKAAA